MFLEARYFSDEQFTKQKNDESYLHQAGVSIKNKLTNMTMTRGIENAVIFNRAHYSEVKPILALKKMMDSKGLTWTVYKLID